MLAPNEHTCGRASTHSFADAKRVALRSVVSMACMCTQRARRDCASRDTKREHGHRQKTVNSSTQSPTKLKSSAEADGSAVGEEQPDRGTSACDCDVCGGLTRIAHAARPRAGGDVKPSSF